MVGIGWKKSARKKGKEQHPIPVKEPLSNKQRSLISSTRKIERSKKGRYAHISTQCGPVFRIAAENDTNSLEGVLNVTSNGDFFSVKKCKILKNANDHFIYLISPLLFNLHHIIIHFHHSIAILRNAITT